MDGDLAFLWYDGEGGMVVVLELVEYLHLSGLFFCDFVCLFVCQFVVDVFQLLFVGLS